MTPDHMTLTTWPPGHVPRDHVAPVVTWRTPRPPSWPRRIPGACRRACPAAGSPAAAAHRMGSHGGITWGHVLAQLHDLPPLQRTARRAPREEGARTPLASPSFLLPPSSLH
eukprot:5219108-Prymnesium_polylepis.1